MKYSKLPIEYQKGYKKFLNCDINLSKKVFIPRPETEFWLKRAIEIIKKKNKPFEALDIFAGSGCIGTCIAKNLDKLCQRIDFGDISEDTVLEIKINLWLNKIPENKYHIYQSDVFEKIKRKYDFIFANPPYIAKERAFLVQKSVLKYEPKEALFAKEKGLFYIKKIIKEGKKYLKEKGIIFLEFDSWQKKEIEKIVKSEKYKGYKFFKDQFDKWRFTIIQK